MSTFPGKSAYGGQGGHVKPMDSSSSDDDAGGEEGYVHMGRSKKEVNARMKPMATREPDMDDTYGYGMTMHLDHDQIGKLGLAGANMPKAGDTIHAMVKMHVRSASSDAVAGSKDGARHSLGATITHVKLHAPPAPKPQAILKRAGAQRAPTPKNTTPGNIKVAAHVRRAPNKQFKPPRPPKVPVVAPAHATRR